MTSSFSARQAGIGLLLIGIGACTASDGGPVAPGSMQTAKAVAGPSVTAATPPYGNRGESGKQVTITGSGFAAGDQASWERNGAADPKIQVLSTQFVSSTQLIATIDIAVDAEVSFYDIAVLRPGRKGGIGTMLFEVTQAVPVAGTSILRGVNEAGLLGSGLGVPGYWSLSTGFVFLPHIPPDGAGVWGIDEAGTTMTGHEGGDIGVIPVWTLVGGTWQHAALPDDPAAVGGRGGAIASDPGSGEAVYIGGEERIQVSAKPNRTVEKPRLWRRGLAGWERIVLPSLAADGGGVVWDVTPGGIAVGGSNSRAVIWEPNGAGGWSIAYLPGTEFIARGINSAADFIGGGTNAYWTRTGTGPWTLAHLSLTCRVVMAVDDLRRIGADNCTQSGNVVRPAVFSPPYSGPPIFLGSLGAKGSAANLEKMSLNGSWIVGQINGQGVYWKVF